MTARAFLDGFRQDDRLLTGGYFSEEPIRVDPGETVGVVLLNLGGPTCAEDVEPFLYNVLMDPVTRPSLLPAVLRDRLCRFLARRQAKRVGQAYEQIGGASPLNRHTEEQARALETRLNERFGAVTGARFRTYTAMRYWTPSSVQAAEQMVKDKVDRVVLLPLYPQYSKTTTGSSLGYWKALEDAGVLPVWPTTFIHEYAAHPKFVQAIAERIDEGLQRFTTTGRDEVQLVFAAQGTAQKALAKDHDPYCCLVHATVQQVMAHREAHDAGRAFHVAFQASQRLGQGLTPTLQDTFETLVDAGNTSVLVVPVSLVSDHVQTAYGLDIAMREEASRIGIEQYEVASGLNCHPLFVETLVECVAAQVTPTSVSRGDGADAVPAALPTLPRYKVEGRTVRCHQCPFVTEAHDWSSEPAVHVPVPPAPSVVPARL